MTGHWFFDAWSPRDGLAFASLWPGKCGDGSRQRTVSLRPPYWRPQPVSPTTALGASRYGFQVGFFDREREPIGFERVQDLIATVRQAFIAGGRPPPPGEQLYELPLPPSDHFDGAESAGTDLRQAVRSDPNSLAAASLAQADPQGPILQTQRGIAEATLHLVAIGVARQNGDAQDLRDWLYVLERMGNWEHPANSWMWLRRELGSISARFEWWPGWVGGVANPIEDGLLFRLPVPDQSLARVSFGAWLVRVMGSRKSFLNCSGTHFSYAFFAASAIVAAAGRPGYGWPKDVSGQRDLLVQTAAWMRREQPMVDEATPQGRALEDYSEKSIHAS